LDLKVRRKQSAFLPFLNISLISENQSFIPSKKAKGSQASRPNEDNKENVLEQVKGLADRGSRGDHDPVSR